MIRSETTNYAKILQNKMFYLKLLQLRVYLSVFNSLHLQEKMLRTVICHSMHEIYFQIIIEKRTRFVIVSK